jgi:hypothetical protein
LQTLLITEGAEGTAGVGGAAAAAGGESLGDFGVEGGFGVPPLGGLMGGVEGADGAGRASVAVPSTKTQSTTAKALRLRAAISLGIRDLMIGGRQNGNQVRLSEAGPGRFRL